MDSCLLAFDYVIFPRTLKPWEMRVKRLRTTQSPHVVATLRL